MSHEIYNSKTYFSPSNIKLRDILVILPSVLAHFYNMSLCSGNILELITLTTASELWTILLFKILHSFLPLLTFYVVLLIYCRLAAGGNLWFRKMKLMQNCLKLAVFLLTCRGDSTGCKKKSVCMKVNVKITLLLTWFMSSVNWFQKLLWSLSLVTSLLQYRMFTL